MRWANYIPPRSRAFSLVEVILAVGIFAASIVAVIGLMSPMTKRVEDVLDAEVASRLSNTIESELQRLGFAWAATTVPAAGAEAAPIRLFADASASRIRLSGAAADAPLRGVDEPGIAERDRYFLIEVRQLAAPFAYVDGVSGSVAVQSRVTWPYQVPAAPGSSTAIATGPGADDFSPVPDGSRSSLTYFFSIRP